MRAPIDGKVTNGPPGRAPYFGTIGAHENARQPTQSQLGEAVRLFAHEGGHVQR